MSLSSRDAEFLSEVVLSHIGGLVTVDETGTIVFATPAVESVLGVSSEKLIGDRLDSVGALGTSMEDLQSTVNPVSAGSHEERQSGQTDHPTGPVATTEYNGTRYYTVLLTDDHRDDQHRTYQTEYRFAGHLPAHRPESLFVQVATACQELARLDDPGTVLEHCIEVVSDTLGYEIARLRKSDTDENKLRPIAETATATRLVESTPGFRLDASRAGRAYRTGEPVVSWSDDNAAVNDLLAESIHVPLGNIGVLTVASTSEGVLLPQDSTALEIVGATITAAAAPDSATATNESAVSASEIDPSLTAQIETLLPELLTVDSRDDLETLVCSRLAAADVCEGAWMSRPDPAHSGVTVTQSTGIDEATATALAESAVTDDSNDVVQVYHETAAGQFTTGDGGPVLLLSLQDTDRLFGLLGLHLTNESVLDTDSVTLLADVMQVVLDAIEKRRLVLSDRTVQLKFQVTDPDCLTVALSDTLGSHCVMKQTIQNTEERYLSYVRVSDATGSAVLAAVEDIDGVRDGRIIHEQGNDCVVELVRDHSGLEVMLEYGATMHTAEATDGRGTLVLEAPPSADIHGIINAYQSYNPDSELLSKREIDREVRTADELLDTITDRLTGKQRAALKAAYYSGYYDWPRESTAEEVASSMDVTASTLHQHLRRAHHKLLTELFESSFE
jgi:predicted DNA binding protein